MSLGSQVFLFALAETLVKVPIVDRAHGDQNLFWDVLVGIVKKHHTKIGENQSKLTKVVIAIVIIVIHCRIAVFWAISVAVGPTRDVFNMDRLDGWTRFAIHNLFSSDSCFVFAKSR